MNDLDLLLAFKASRTQVVFNGEPWTVRDAQQCPGVFCTQQRQGNTCAGLVALVNGDGWHWFGLHVDAAADLTDVSR